MRQLRRCMLVVLCVCVMGALTGCGNDNADQKTDKATDKKTTDQKTDKTTKKDKK